MPAAARQSAETGVPDAEIAPPPETLRETSPAGLPGPPGAASQFRSIPRYPSLLFPLCNRQPQSHSRSSPPDKQGHSEERSDNKKRRQDGHGGVKGRR